MEKSSSNLDSIIGQLYAKASQCEAEIKTLIKQLPAAADEAERNTANAVSATLRASLAATARERDDAQAQLTGLRDRLTAANTKVDRLRTLLASTPANNTAALSLDQRNAERAQSVRSPVSKIKPDPNCFQSGTTAPVKPSHEKHTANSSVPSLSMPKLNLTPVVNPPDTDTLPQRFEAYQPVSDNRAAKRHAPTVSDDAGCYADVNSSQERGQPLSKHRKTASSRRPRMTCKPCYGQDNCDGAPCCSNCHPEQCVYSWCRIGGACQSLDCTMAHPDQDDSQWSGRRFKHLPPQRSR